MHVITCWTILLEGVSILKYDLKPHINIADFLHAVDLCDKEVLFESREGDRLNLQSQLSKYLFLTVGLDLQYLKSCRISCTAADAARLSDFIVIPNLKKGRNT